MKKVIIMGIVVGMAVVSQAGLVDWNSISLKNDPKLDSGDGSWTGGWQVELWQDVGNDNTAGWQNTLPLSSGANGAENDIALGLFTVTTATPQIITRVISTPVPNDIQIYTVLYNNSVKANATRYLVYDDVTFNSGTVEAPGTPIAYLAGIQPSPPSIVGDAAGDWQVIPEPATIGLMGIAGLGMFLARRKVRS